MIAARAVGHEPGQGTRLALRRLARTLKRNRTFELNINGHSIDATSQLPADIYDLILLIAEAKVIYLSRVDRVITHLRNWTILHSDYRRLTNNFKDTIPTVIARHFWATA